MKIKFKNYLSKIDLFGYPITMSVNQQNKFNTWVGGVFSIGLVLILAWLCVNQVILLQSKSQITSFENTLYSVEPDKIEFNKDNYFMALSILQTQSFVESPYFNITLIESSKELINSTSFTQRTPIDLVPCTYDMYARVFQDSVESETSFQNFGFSQWLCPNWNKIKKLQISGTYGNSNFKYLKIQVSNCINNTAESSLSWQPVCQSDNELQEFIKQGGIKLQIYVSNNQINPQSTQDFIQTQISTDLYFTLNPNIVTPNVDIYFRKNVFENDESISFNSQTKQTVLYTRETYELSQQLQYNTGPTNIYGQFNLRRSPVTINTVRKYLKVDASISYIGGIFGVIFQFLTVFLNIYNQQAYFIYMANHLFNLQKTKVEQNRQILDKVNDVQVKNGQKKALSFQHEHHFHSLDKLPEDMVQNQQLLCQIKNIRSKCAYFIEQIKSIISKKDQLRISCTLLLNQIFCRQFFNTKDAQLLNKAIVEVQNQQDIINLFQKIHEIDKLKNVVLNKSQKHVFNFTPKKVISLDEKLQINLHKLQQDLIKKNKQKNHQTQEALFEIYLNIQELQRDLNNNQINSKLLKLLGPEVNFYLKVMDCLQLPEDQEILSQIKSDERVNEEIIQKSKSVQQDMSVIIQGYEAQNTVNN